MSRAQIRTCETEDIFDLLNSHDQKITLDAHLLIGKECALDEAEEKVPEPKKRPLWFEVD